MMGGLHIEMASLKMVGQWLNNSGWDSALVQADITIRGKADAILKAAYITRSRCAHQVSAWHCISYSERFTRLVSVTIGNLQILIIGCRSSVKHIPSFFSGQLRLNWNY